MGDNDNGGDNGGKKDDETLKKFLDESDRVQRERQEREKRKGNGEG